jgi:RNA polymerase sigma-70 factor (ECF subfamily)
MGGVKAVATPADVADLVNHSWAPLWAIAVSIVRDRHLAHDVVQEAAMIALSKTAEFQPGTPMLAWVGQIVRFVALNARRRGTRDPVAGVDPEQLHSSPSREVGPAATAGVAIADPRLAAALDALEDTPRECVIMRIVLDMSYPEIAAALDIPEGTAMSHVFRSRKLLRQRLGPADEGGTT